MFDNIMLLFFFLSSVIAAGAISFYAYWQTARRRHRLSLSVNGG